MVEDESCFRNSEMHVSPYTFMVRVKNGLSELMKSGTNNPQFIN